MERTGNGSNYVLYGASLRDLLTLNQPEEIKSKKLGRL